ncbi:hypothetical protein AOZ06_33270 [Kibdelosporangium phytohabitans]|uniref:CHAT domain-containing protein n=2 Tax=Kibdelosporangium phytohabitans TaxID=860235 RepID=A0A0N9I8J0_9PSEU|nr:hypothetical protein AOZ06_33270 [Kibdelosporangium phytohabitans]
MTHLEVLDYAGPTKWRWRLTTSTGEFVADHSVSLDETEWQYEAFTDLYRYLKWNAVPDRRVAHEAELTAQVADWVRSRVFGDVLAGVRGPVRLEVPPEAGLLAYRPWELAGGSFVIDLPHPSRTKADVGDRLRMLAVFSLPEGAGALNLRKERHALTRLVREIAAVNEKGIELRVLQYGATRERLEEALLEQSGWDVVHLSGHGLPAGLVLEDDTGSRDLITSTELVDLLDEAGDQIKLVTLSACESAAVTATEHLQLLGLSPAVRSTSEPAGSLPAVATEILRRLDCAVLAMRYPVVDDFAIALTGRFYDLVLGKGKSVAGALAVALSKVTSGPPTAAIPALSAATPTLFGARSGDLRLVPPPGGPVELKVDRQKLAEFPEQLERFVGRVGPMTRATTALAPRSGSSGVLFHGMAGAGKTSCAVELAYTHQESFPFMAWHVAPPEGHEIATALAGFVRALERQLPGLKLVHRIGDIDMLRAALPNLTEVLENNRVLIVLDNVESLLTDKGEWRDDRWALLIHALTNHRGFSRLVLTSRRKPLGLRDSVLCEAVHALSLRESVLLAREWPNLRALIDDEPELAVRTLQIVQGHPKLLEFAEAIAADKATLTERLDQADSTWDARGARLDAFVRGDEPVAGDDDYFAVLETWTTVTMATLPDKSVVLFHFLCCVEEADRNEPVVRENWSALWQAHRAGDPPPIAEALGPLVDRAVVGIDGEGYRIHPGIAGTGRDDADSRFRSSVDVELGKFWRHIMSLAVEHEGQESSSAAVQHAAIGAAPYLFRQRNWPHLDNAIQMVLQRDYSLATMATLLPFASAAAEATRGTQDELVVARTHGGVLSRLDPGQAEIIFRDLLNLALDRGDFGRAAIVADSLVGLYRNEGRLEAALDVLDRKAEYSEKAGLGPTVRLTDDAHRLRIMELLGRGGDDVLASVTRLLAEWRAVEASGGYPLSVPVWSPVENLLSTGTLVAERLGQWRQALDFNTELIESMRRRGATALDQAVAAYNGSRALMQLGMVAEARNVLLWCREVWDQGQDMGTLAKVFARLAEAEDKLGHSDRALDIQLDSLRLTYPSRDPKLIAFLHNRVAMFAYRSYGEFSWAVWAHFAAAAMILWHDNRAALDENLAVLQGFKSGVSDDMRSFEEISQVVEHTAGVRLADLLQHMGVADCQALLCEVLHAAEQSATAS